MSVWRKQIRLVIEAPHSEILIRREAIVPFIIKNIDDIRRRP